jgi:hypothetical protein
MALQPIYTTRGENAAFFENGNLFNLGGEWIGFVDVRNGYVYSVLGEYVGFISKDGRILRKRAMDEIVPRKAPPRAPARIKAPTSVPLPPMVAELGFDSIDVLDEMPDRLHTMDAGELKDDMD